MPTSQAARGGFAALLACLLPAAAGAMEIETGNSDFKVRWDNTIKYTAAARVADQLPASLANINGDEGNRAFRSGLISNRVDLLSELDLSYRNSVGARFSGAAWYDQLYNQANDDTSPTTFNPISVDSRHFTHATRNLVGRKLDLLDAFVWGNGELGGLPASIRAGRHTLLWGESLLIPNNGIASVQAPLDIVKAQSVPNTLAKELFLPVTQFSGSLQLSSEFSLAAYAQAEWRRYRLSPVGGYFSTADLLDVGGERLFAGTPSRFFSRTVDQAPSQFNFGQGGIAARYRLDRYDTDLGFYFINYHDKVPQVVLRPGVLGPPGQIGQYFLLYPKNAHLVGASFSTDIGDANVAGEISERFNEPLVSAAQTALPGVRVDDNHPLGAVGSSFHAQISTLYNLPPFSLWEGGTFTGEIAYARRTSISRNAAALDPTTHVNALGVRFIFAPAYFQALPGLDITLPLGLGYNPIGRSSVVQSFNGDGGADNGGDVTIGITGTFLNVWLASLTYTRYFEFASLTKNPIIDRDFVALSVRRTF